MAKIFVCGDIVNMGECNIFIGDKLTTVIKDSDYAIGNLEGPELETLQIAPFPHQGVGTIKYLKDTGFDMMLLANNHITEMGEKGLVATMKLLDDAGMDRIGAGLSWEEAYKPLIRIIDGLKFSFINVCEAQEGFYRNPAQSYGFAWMGYDGLFDSIKEMQSKSDYVVVFVHTGLEHYSIPLPEVRDFYHKLCDAGASVVVGGHTHTPQGYEYYGDKLIAYSLGNFYMPRSDGSWKEENRSYSLSLEFRQNSKVEVTPFLHCLCGDKVELNNDNGSAIDLNALCAKLSDDYLANANDMCIDAYKNKYSKILAMATCGEPCDAGLADAVKNIVRTTVFRKKYVTSTIKSRNNQILICLQNETRRSTIIRALSNMN